MTLVIRVDIVIFLFSGPKFEVVAVVSRIVSSIREGI